MLLAQEPGDSQGSQPWPRALLCEELEMPIGMAAAPKCSPPELAFGAREVRCPPSVSAGSTGGDFNPLQGGLRGINVGGGG